jgi:hypothetical protein
VLGFEYNASGSRSLFTLENCALTRNFIMTGTGFYNITTDRFVLDVSTSGRWQCHLKYTRTGERIKVTGKCNGKPIGAESMDDDARERKSPELNRQKDNH